MAISQQQMNTRAPPSQFIAFRGVIFIKYNCGVNVNRGVNYVVAVEPTPRAPDALDPDVASGVRRALGGGRNVVPTRTNFSRVQRGVVGAVAKSAAVEGGPHGKRGAKRGCP